MRTAEIKIVVKLDGIPGWGDKPEDFVEHFRNNSGIPHYIQSVELVEPLSNPRKGELFHPPSPFKKNDDTPYGEGGPGSDTTYFSFSD